MEQYNGAGAGAEASGQETQAIPELRQRFQEMVDRHYEPLWGYVGLLTGGASDAEDILHQAFLLAFDRLAAGREFEGEPAKWLRGTVRNLVRVWWRQRRKLPQDVADRLKLLADQADDIPTTVANKELRAALARCMGKLGPHDRQLLARRYEQGLRVTAIAQQMRRNAATVRVRLFRIRQALKLCVEAQLAHGGAT